MYPRRSRPFIFSRGVLGLTSGRLLDKCFSVGIRCKVPTYCETRVIDYVSGLVMHFVHGNEKSITFSRSLTLVCECVSQVITEVITSFCIYLITNIV